MSKNGLDMWDSIYPNKDTLETDIKSGDAYGFYSENILLGYISINDSFDEAYDSLNWKYTNAESLTVHRVSVRPTAQGQGIAKKLMAFAESYVKEKNYKVIKLDAFSKNPSAVNLYKKLGYEYVGDVDFRKGLFHCFEKKL